MNARPGPHEKLASQLSAILRRLLLRAGAETACLAQPSGRVIMAEGAPLSSSWAQLRSTVSPLDRGTLLVRADLPELGAMYLSPLHFAHQPIELVVRCNTPRLPRYQQVILETATRLQACLDAFSVQITLTVDDWSVSSA